MQNFEQMAKLKAQEMLSGAMGGHQQGVPATAGTTPSAQGSSWQNTAQELLSGAMGHHNAAPGTTGTEATGAGSSAQGNPYLSAAQGILSGAVGQHGAPGATTGAAAPGTQAGGAQGFIDNARAKVEDMVRREGMQMVQDRFLGGHK